MKELVREVIIPAGVDSGMQLCCEVMGKRAMEPVLEETCTFRNRSPGTQALHAVDGSDIMCRVPVTFAQAALGADIEIPTLAGRRKINDQARTLSQATSLGCEARYAGSSTEGSYR